MLKPGKFPNSPNIKVSAQATKVSIIIQRKRMMNLLIIKLMRDTGIVSKFFSVSSAYSRVSKYATTTPYKGNPITKVVYKLTSVNN